MKDIPHVAEFRRYADLVRGCIMSRSNKQEAYIPPNPSKHGHSNTTDNYQKNTDDNHICSNRCLQ